MVWLNEHWWASTSWIARGRLLAQHGYPMQRHNTLPSQTPKPMEWNGMWWRVTTISANEAPHTIITPSSHHHHTTNANNKPGCKVGGVTQVALETLDWTVHLICCTIGVQSTQHNASTQCIITMHAKQSLLVVTWQLCLNRLGQVKQLSLELRVHNGAHEFDHHFILLFTSLFLVLLMQLSTHQHNIIG